MIRSRMIRVGHKIFTEGSRTTTISSVVMPVTMGGSREAKIVSDKRILQSKNVAKKMKFFVSSQEEMDPRYS